jgi:hypothetical protein
MSLARAAILEPTPIPPIGEGLYLVPSNDLDRMLREFLEQEPEEKAERRALRSSVDRCIREVIDVRKDLVRNTADLQGEIRGVSARVSQIENSKSAAHLSIPPPRSFMNSLDEDSSIHTITKQNLEELTKEVNKANAALAWGTVKGGVWHVALFLAGAIALGGLGLLFHHIFP